MARRRRQKGVRQFKAEAGRTVKITTSALQRVAGVAVAPSLPLATEPNEPTKSHQLVVDLPFLRPVLSHHERPSKGEFVRVARVASCKLVELGLLSRPDLLEIGDQGAAAIEAMPDGVIEGIGCCYSDHRGYRQRFGK
jgi:hypothetical protein